MGLVGRLNPCVHWPIRTGGHQRRPFCERRPSASSHALHAAPANNRPLCSCRAVVCHHGLAPRETPKLTRPMAWGSRNEALTKYLRVALGINEVIFDGQCVTPKPCVPGARHVFLQTPTPVRVVMGTRRVTPVDCSISMQPSVCKLQPAMWGGWPRLRSMVDSAASPASPLAGQCG